MLHFPATQRNGSFIAKVLEQYVFPTSDHGKILEIASGSGEHCKLFASMKPSITFHPTDLEVDHLKSIQAHTKDLNNVEQPVLLDVLNEEHWHQFSDDFDAMICINMIHISPFACTHALFQQAAKHLKPGKFLFLYGPFRRNGAHISESNIRFDASLKARDETWGVRDLEQEVVPLAKEHGFVLVQVIDMPANNHSVLFKKQ